MKIVLVSYISLSDIHEYQTKSDVPEDDKGDGGSKLHFGAGVLTLKVMDWIVKSVIVDDDRI